MLTERPARVRVLGKSQTVPLNATAFGVLTGNGLTVSEDLERRFIAIELDPMVEDPEARQFATDIRHEVTKRRSELLAALLTIWRWGRQCKDTIRGCPMGSFEQWSIWVRDPLLALGCQDPVNRVSEAKERDSRRQEIKDLFEAWERRHQDKPVTANELQEDVQRIIDPLGKSRQHVAAYLGNLAGTRVAGKVLLRQAAPGKWGAATYALLDSEQGKHRDHRDERNPSDPPTEVSRSPMPPMPPMVSPTPQ